MTKTTHIAIGLHTALLGDFFFLPTLLGATLPDCDIAWAYHRTGRGFKPRPGLPKWLAHRGFTHHFLIYAAIFVIADFMHPFWRMTLQGFAFGALSHIIADMLTPGGIPIWSFKQKFSLHLFKTRSNGEYFFLAALTIALFFVPKQLYHNQFILLELLCDFIF